MDLMQVLYVFGSNVAEALNEAKVKPPEGDFFGGVIVMAAKNYSGKKKRTAPLAGSLNYNKEQEKWLWTDQLEQGTAIAEDVEPG